MDFNRNGASSIRGFNSAAMTSNGANALFAELLSALRLATCGHRCCKECMNERTVSEF